MFKSADVAKKFIVTTNDVCEFFGISREALSKWEKSGAPKVGRGKWNLKKLVEWKYGDGGKPDSAAARKLEADASYRELKVEITEIQKEILNGKYVSVEETKRELIEVFAKVKSGLTFLGHKIAMEMNAQYPEFALDAKRIVDEEIERGLTEIAKTGTYSGAKQKRKSDPKARN